MKKEFIEKAYELARQEYAEMGVNTDEVLKKLDELVISLHCWQTDDVGDLRRPVPSWEAGFR